MCFEFLSRYQAAEVVISVVFSQQWIYIYIEIHELLFLALVFNITGHEGNIYIYILSTRVNSCIARALSFIKRHGLLLWIKGGMPNLQPGFSSVLLVSPSSDRASTKASYDSCAA